MFFSDQLCNSSVAHNLFGQCNYNYINHYLRNATKIQYSPFYGLRICTKYELYHNLHERTKSDARRNGLVRNQFQLNVGRAVGQSVLHANRNLCSVSII